MENLVRENFKALRKEINISQEQMADFLGLEQSSISKFESGERNLGISSLEKACALFGISLNELSTNNSKIKSIAPSFRKSEISIASLEDIAKINKVAMNIIEMKKILDK